MTINASPSFPDGLPCILLFYINCAKCCFRKSGLQVELHYEREGAWASAMLYKAVCPSSSLTFSLPSPILPNSPHFSPLCSFYFVIILKSSEIQKMKCGLRWVEVDLNPPQPTSIHFVFSIFVFMLISLQIKKIKCGLRWVEVDLNPPQPTSTHLNPTQSTLYFIFFCFYVDIKGNTKK